MNNIESKKLYVQLESSANQALNVKTPEEFAEIFIPNIAQVLATDQRLEGFRQHIADTGKIAVTKFANSKLQALNALDQLIKPILTYKFSNLSIIVKEYDDIKRNHSQNLNLMIFELCRLLEKACSFIIYDWRWNRHHDHTQILTPLVKFDGAGKEIFIFHHVLENYYQAQQEFNDFTSNSVFDSFNKIISVYKAHGLVLFIGPESKTLNIKACNMSLQHILPYIKENLLSQTDYIISSKDISYDCSTGYLTIKHNNANKYIKFMKNSLRGKILEVLFPAGKPRKESISFAEIYDEIKHQKNHHVWHEFDCPFFDDLDSDNTDDCGNKTSIKQENIKKNIRDSIDGKDAINDRIIMTTQLEKIIFIDNLNVFVRCN